MNLLAHPFFTYFSDRHARALAEFAEEFPCNENTILFEEDDAADCVYVVLEGEVELSKKTQTDRQINIAMVKAGDYFGEMGILSDKPRSARATTTTYSRVAKIPGPVLLRILNEERGYVTLQLLRTIVEHLRRANERYVEEVLKREKGA